jgi:hypothetical protein
LRLHLFSFRRSERVDDLDDEDEDESPISPHFNLRITVPSDTTTTTGVPAKQSHAKQSGSEKESEEKDRLIANLRKV